MRRGGEHVVDGLLVRSGLQVEHEEEESDDDGGDDLLEGAGREERREADEDELLDHLEDVKVKVVRRERRVQEGDGARVRRGRLREEQRRAALVEEEGGEDDRADGVEEDGAPRDSLRIVELGRRAEHRVVLRVRDEVALIVVEAAVKLLARLEGAKREGGDGREGDEEHEQRERHSIAKQDGVNKAALATAQRVLDERARVGLLHEEREDEADQRRARDRDDRPDHQKADLIGERAEAVAGVVDTPRVNLPNEEGGVREGGRA